MWWRHGRNIPSIRQVSRLRHHGLLILYTSIVRRRRRWWCRNRRDTSRWMVSCIRESTRYRVIDAGPRLKLVVFILFRRRVIISVHLALACDVRGERISGGQLIGVPIDLGGYAGCHGFGPVITRCARVTSVYAVLRSRFLPSSLRIMNLLAENIASNITVWRNHSCGRIP